MARLTTILLLLFCIGFGLYVTGSPQIYQSFVSNDVTGSGGTVIGSGQGWGQPDRSIFDIFWDIMLGTIIGGFGALAASFISPSFSVIYIIPAGFVGGLVGYFMQPVSYINNLGLPTELLTFINGFFAVIILSGIISFIFGRD